VLYTSRENVYLSQKLSVFAGFLLLDLYILITAKFSTVNELIGILL
jgi:hypothetical protein